MRIKQNVNFTWIYYIFKMICNTFLTMNTQLLKVIPSLYGKDKMP